MTDDDRERFEVLEEALGECMAQIAALREELAGIADSHRLLTPELKVHGHELQRLTAAIERIAPDDDDEQSH